MWWLPLDPQSSERRDKLAAETIGIKHLRPAVSAGGDEIQVIKSIVMALPRHAGNWSPRRRTHGSIHHL